MRATKPAKTTRLLISLGNTWQAFVPSVADAELLGTVRRGAQIGALARLPDGRYAQVNGDWITPLNKAQVEHALRSAGALPFTMAASAAPANVPPRPAVTVRVRKRRTPVLPPTANTPKTPTSS